MVTVLKLKRDFNYPYLWILAKKRGMSPKKFEICPVLDFTSEPRGESNPSYISANDLRFCKKWFEKSPVRFYRLDCVLKRTDVEITHDARDGGIDMFIVP